MLADRIGRRKRRLSSIEDQSFQGEICDEQRRKRTVLTSRPSTGGMLPRGTGRVVIATHYTPQAAQASSAARSSTTTMAYIPSLCSGCVEKLKMAGQCGGTPFSMGNTGVGVFGCMMTEGSSNIKMTCTIRSDEVTSPPCVSVHFGERAYALELILFKRGIERGCSSSHSVSVPCQELASLARCCKGVLRINGKDQSVPVLSPFPS